jgi:hypothetical protein
MKSRFLVLLVPVICAFTITAHAQIPASIGGLELTLSTASPIPGQTVTITARSYTIDINTAKVSWYVDGKLIKSTVGDTVYELKAPALGKKLAIDVTAVTKMEPPTRRRRNQLLLFSSIIVQSLFYHNAR